MEPWGTFWQTMFAAACAAGGAYAAVRVELRWLKARTIALEDELKRAHRRIDDLFRSQKL
jgi:hypothetical protein